MSHGGSRPVKRKDDKRVIKKLVSPVRKTLILENKQWKILKKLYGRNWQDFIRSLIDIALEP